MKKLLYVFSIFSFVVYVTGCFLTEDQGAMEVGYVPQQPADFTTTPDEDSSAQAPEELPPPPPPPPSPVPGYFEIFNEEVDFQINNGAVRTASADLQLQLIAPPLSYSRVMLSANDHCGDAQLIPFAESLTVPAAKLNGLNSLSVRYVDDDNVVTQCMTRSIVHDNLPPEVVISKYPTTNLEQGMTASLTYSVTDASPIAEVVCTLNDIEKACGPGTVNVEISALPEGHYRFSVKATDVLGHTSIAAVEWNVVSTTRHLVQNFFVNNYNKVDILIVIDNSGSMEYEQKNMAQRVSNFLSILQGLDWRIGVTTTDPSSTSKTNTTHPNIDKVSDGLFLPIYGLNQQYYLESSMNHDEAQYRLGMTLQRPERGSGSEQAINATYRVLERGFGKDSAKNPVQRDFFRPGAHFAVLVISDEDESANGTRNDPQNLLNLVNTTFNGQKAFSWHSIITRPGDKDCRNTHGYSYGQRYYDFSMLTGGLIGSVCEADYAAQLMGVANKIRQLVKTLTLTCQPLPQFPIMVTKDGAPYGGSFTIEGVNLNFAAELPPGNYAVDYHCLK